MIANHASKRDLLKLPMLSGVGPAGWYDALLIVPSHHKHSSGWAHIAVIGVMYTDEGDSATNILAFPDDLQWPAKSALKEFGDLSDYGALRTDAYYPSGVMRLWSRHFQFSIDFPTSSVEILLRRKRT